MNPQKLFVASCVALIATSMSFAIRGDIMGDFQDEFVVPFVSETGADSDVSEDEQVKATLGVIGTIAFFSFGLAILFGGPLVDLFGMGLLLRVAAVCHISGTLLTIFAPGYYAVIVATLLIGAGNGLVEAVCNPLIATLYPEQKTQKLTMFHAWFPGGLVIGGLLSYGFTQMGIGWQPKMALILVPSVIYVVMIFSEKFPQTERVAAGLPFSEMISEALRRPLFWIVFAMMWLTASTELGPGSWIPNIYNDIQGEGASAGILFVVWGSIIMYVLRQFFAKQAHSISPMLLITITAPFAGVGLFMFKFAETPLMFFIAITLMYFGVCFWWPTMLGITSERCPKTGALGLAIIGATGSFSTSGSGPIIGILNDRYGPAQSLQFWAILPAVLFIVFGLVYMKDRSTGGYQAERLDMAEEAPGSDL